MDSNDDPADAESQAGESGAGPGRTEGPETDGGTADDDPSGPDDGTADDDPSGPDDGTADDDPSGPDDGTADDDEAGGPITKRRVLGGVAVLLVVVLLLVLLVVPWSLLGLAFNSSAEFEAQPVTVGQGPVADNGYEAVLEEQFEATEQLSILGQPRSIVATNHRMNYERTIDVQGEQFDAAVFTVVSTPAITVASRPLNPVASMSHDELLTEFSDDLEGGYEGMENFSRVTQRDGVLLGQQTTVSQFETSIETNGERVDVYLYVTTARSNGDVVVAVGGHPAPFAQERASILELMAGVDHPAD
jgi:hypothetical protein